MCGTCDSDYSNDCVQDCSGVWGGSAVEASYYFDSDGDGLGSGSSTSFCDAFVTDGWVGNADDAEPNCATNDTDECNVCGGDNSSCADCAGVPNGDSVLDQCGTCDADASNDCTADCAGVYGGSSVVDQCNVCDSNPDNDCVQDCAGTWGGTAAVDQCGVCAGDNSICADCAGVPNGN